MVVGHRVSPIGTSFGGFWLFGVEKRVITEPPFPEVLRHGFRTVQKTERPAIHSDSVIINVSDAAILKIVAL